MKQRLTEFLSRIAGIGADPADDDDARLQKSLLVLCSIPFMLAGFVWGIMYAWLGEPLAGAIPFSYAVFSLFSLIYFGATHSYRYFRFSQLLLILLLPFLLMLSLGGYIYGSAVILWALISPLGALLFDEPRHALRWLVAFLALIVLSGILEPYLNDPDVLSLTAVNFFFVLNLVGVGGLVFVMVYYFVLQKNKYQQESEVLLLNVLPKDIAAILKHEKRTIAEQYDEASVMFADMVGFTPLSAELAPVQLVDLLNEIFSYFDSLLDKYEVEKIRTIGDNYMAACGLPRRRPDHAQTLVCMALEMRDYVRTHTFLGGRHLDFRIGINSGPMIAGVIGSRKFVYDVWGDAVNIASRMESHGRGGTIQITRTTYDLVQNEFVCEPRGTVDVKGKGAMEVWFVLEAANAAAAEATP